MRPASPDGLCLSPSPYPLTGGSEGGGRAEADGDMERHVTVPGTRGRNVQRSSNVLTNCALLRVCVALRAGDAI
jgi:hypothetical protein